MVTFETERLLLRPWQSEDAADCYLFARDPDIGTRAGWKPHASIQESIQIIRDVLSTEGIYAVVLKETGQPIGSIGLQKPAAYYEAAPGDLELGYWVGKPFWGKGLVCEAAQVLMDDAFENGRTDKIWVSHFSTNPQSRRVIEKLRFDWQKDKLQVHFPLIQSVKDLSIYTMDKDRHAAIKSAN